MNTKDLKRSMITVRDLINFVEENAKYFSEGLDTPITCGYSEEIYIHYNLHQYIDSVENWEDGYENIDEFPVIFLQYEMHEDRGE